MPTIIHVGVNIAGSLRLRPRNRRGGALAPSRRGLRFVLSRPGSHGLRPWKGANAGGAANGEAASFAGRNTGHGTQVAKRSVLSSQVPCFQPLTPKKAKKKLSGTQIRAESHLTPTKQTTAPHLDRNKKRCFRRTKVSGSVAPAASRRL